MAEKKPPIIDYEGSDYQTTFWDSGGREYEDRVENIALQRLLPPQGSHLLEVGAGAGRNTPRYQGYQQVTLLDYSLTQLMQAKDRLGKSPRYTYVAGDVYRLPFLPGIYDGATMIRVLHHMAQPRRALDEIHRVMTPGSTFILEYANKQNLKAILRYLVGGQAWNPFSREPVEFVELNFDFHPRHVRTLLQEVGFEVQRQLTVSHFRINFLKNNLPTGLLVTLDALAQWTGDYWQLSPSVFVRAEAVGDHPQTGDHELIFQCPACRSSSWEESTAQLTCTACGTTYPIQDGIYDFRDQP